MSNYLKSCHISAKAGPWKMAKFRRNKEDFNDGPMVEWALANQEVDSLKHSNDCEYIKALSTKDKDVSQSSFVPTHSRINGYVRECCGKCKMKISFGKDCFKHKRPFKCEIWASAKISFQAKVSFEASLNFNLKLGTNANNMLLLLLLL